MIAAGRIALGALVVVLTGVGSRGADDAFEVATWRPAAPTAVPVLLVPGWLESDRDLAALRIRLIAAGWQADEVETLAFRDPTGGNREHADEIAAAVDSLKARSGSAVVDIVAHSMGGLATRWHLLRHTGHSVRRVVFIASPHHGTYSAYLAWGGSREEMQPGSAFLDTLNASPPVPDGVEALTVRTLVDTHILPPESAILPGVPDHVVCCPTHGGLLRDADVFVLIRSFLEDGF